MKDDSRDDENYGEEEENEDESIRLECQQTLLNLAGHLRTLLSCQDSLERLAFHTERLLRLHSSMRHGSVRPRKRQTERSQTDSWYYTSNAQKASEEWKDNLLPLEGKVFPPVQSQGESVHWQKILQEAQAIEDAVRRLTRTADLTQSELEQIQREHGTAQMLDKGNKSNPYRNEVWTFQALQRDIDWSLPLIRSVATVCQIMGDFGDARERHSAASVAYISEQLAQCANDMEQDSRFFLFYADLYPKRRLQRSERQLLKDAALIQRSAKALREDKKFEVLAYTPPVIAEIMGLSSDTVRRCIEDMEDKYSARTRKETKAMEEEMVRAGKDISVHKMTHDANVSEIKKEQKGELKPRQSKGKTRRTYTWMQVQEIVGYYNSLPSRWRERKS